MLGGEVVLQLFIVLGLLYSVLIVTFSNKIAASIGVLCHPGAQGHHGHEKPTPLVGGLVAIPPAIAILFAQCSQNGLASPQSVSYLAFAFATMACFVVGLVDDRRHIPAIIRLIVCGAVFACTIFITPDFVVSTLDLQAISFKIELGLLAIPFSVFCLLALQNAVNMADGRNGLVIGVSIIWLMTLLTYGWHPLTLSIVSLAIGLLIALGANLGGRLFLGDAGTYGIGAFVGLATIWFHRSNIGLHTGDIIIMFMVPVIDMARLFVFRIATGRHPFSADYHHLHHYLDRAVGWNLGLKIYYTIVAVPILVTRFGIFDQTTAIILSFGFYVAAVVLAQAAKKQ